MAPARFYSQLAKKLLSWRFLSDSRVNMATSQSSVSTLAKLRKTTGYSMSNCKKALQMHAGDMEKAESWLHEEARKQGWSKIANLEHRTAAQGLVAVYCKDSVGAMVEVNCETDFVARNTEFQAFVTKVLSSCIKHSIDCTSNEDCQKLSLNAENLIRLKSGSETLGDLTAHAVGKFGEKTIIKRAVCFKTGSGVILSSFSHPTNPCLDLTHGTFGKYGGLVAYRPTNISNENQHEILSECGYQLCQHIVGMSPHAIGDIQQAIESKKEKATNVNIGVKKLEAEDLKEDIVIKDEKNSEEAEGEAEDEVQVEQDGKLEDSNETRLVFQQFLMDPTMNIAEYLVKNSLEVVDFQRFECGESDN